MADINDKYSYGCIYTMAEVLLADLNVMLKELSFYVENEESELHSLSLRYLKRKEELEKLLEKIKQTAVD